jgi:CTP:molybdopterin cytidylyltransferase MocA
MPSRYKLQARFRVLKCIGARALLPDLLVAVLAAGASRRLGRAKQLVPIGGEPLLRRQCRCALSAQVGEVVAILGCDQVQHREIIIDLPIDVRVNDEWEEGLAATLRSAVRVAQGRRAALLVLPCDQYRIIPEDLRALYDHWRWTPCIACASRRGRYAGPPAILPIHCHDYVLGLHGDIGARSLLYHSRRPSPDEIANPRAGFDLDSPEDMRIAEAWTACQM